eukprot:jgi/Mesvir1/12703/Mv01701-RA.1
MVLKLWRLNPHRDQSRFKGVRTAPPRTCLTMFGGDMTIEQFRACTTSEIHMVAEPPYDIETVQQVHCVLKIRERDRTMKKDAAPQAPAAASDGEKKPEKDRELALKRSKPMVNKSFSLDKFVVHKKAKK